MPSQSLIFEQGAKLRAVIASDAPPEVRSLAEHYLAKVRYWERQPEAAQFGALSELGPNQYGPAIDDVVAQAEHKAARFRKLNDEPDNAEIVARIRQCRPVKQGQPA